MGSKTASNKHARQTNKTCRHGQTPVWRLPEGQGEGEGRVKRAEYTVRAGDVALGGDHTRQHTDDASLNRTLDTCVTLLIDVAEKVNTICTRRKGEGERGGRRDEPRVWLRSPGAVATTLVIPLTAGDSGAPHGVPEGRTFGRLRQTRHCRPRDALQSRSFSRALSTRQAKREPGAVAFNGVTRTRLPGVSLPLPRRETLLRSRLLVVYPKPNKQNLVTALPPLSLCALF